MAKTNIRGTQIADGANGVDLTVDVTGTLPVANGGTGHTTVGTSGQALTSNGTSLTYTDMPTVASTRHGVAETLPLNMAGNSYGAYTGNAQEIFYDRLKAQLHSRVHFNASVQGARAADMCQFLYGNVAGIRQGASSDATGQVSGKCTYTPEPLTGGVWILESAMNDAGYDGSTVSGGTTLKSRTGFVNALDSTIRLLRASSVQEDNDAAFTYGGTWVDDATYTGARGGRVKYSTVPGSTWTIPIASGPNVDRDVILLGIDSPAFFNFVGSAFTVTVDGSPYTNPNGFTATNDLMRATAGPAGAFYVQVAIPIRGLTPNTSHTVVITHAGSSGHLLFADCVLTPSPTPPTIVLNKTPYLPSAGYASYAGATGGTVNATLFAAYDGLIDAVAARFPSDGSIVVWDPKAAGMDSATMIGNYDGFSIHLNDYGNWWYAERLREIIEALPSRLGLDVPRTTPVLPTGIAGGGTQGQILSRGATEYTTAWQDRRRVYSTASTATLTIDASSYDSAKVTAQAAALTVAAPTGTPADMQGLIIRITDNGTIRAITWNSIFKTNGPTLPSTTVANKTVYVGCCYNSELTKWDVIAVSQEP